MRGSSILGASMAALIGSFGVASAQAPATGRSRGNTGRIIDESTPLRPLGRRYSVEANPFTRAERRAQHLARLKADGTGLDQYGVRCGVSGAKLARKAAKGTVGRAYLR